MKQLLSLLIICLPFVGLYAQHEHHGMQKDSSAEQIPSRDTMPQDHDHKHNGGEMASHAYSMSLPMSRNGSGTGWNPDAVPMYMWMKQKGQTSWMFHGNIVLRYTSQDIFSSGTRGGSAFSAPNWFMVMMNRKTGKRGLFNATAMLSLDRLTDGGNGYPLLFQSGETYKGKPLVDRQHPHDLFSALSVGYTYRVSKQVDIFAYLGYPGEPALGAPAFMHRVSSMNNPDAPLGHHWQDATHITFGTGTLGLRYGQLKLEGSVFTGREPDEERFGFDKARFDSYSYRLSWNPSASWALQFSQGFIQSPEASSPAKNINRTTASVLFARPTSRTDHLSAAAIWGFNKQDATHKEHSFLLEGNYQYRKNAFYSRYEWVQKSPEELLLPDEYPHGNNNIHAVTAGYNRSLGAWKGIELLAGTQMTWYGANRLLDPLYGQRPLSAQVYVQIRPWRHGK